MDYLIIVGLIGVVLAIWKYSTRGRVKASGGYSGRSSKKPEFDKKK